MMMMIYSDNLPFPGLSGSSQVKLISDNEPFQGNGLKRLSLSDSVIKYHEPFTVRRLDLQTSARTKLENGAAMPNGGSSLRK